MKNQDQAVRAVFILLVVLGALPALAGPQPGTDCACATVGNYVLPAPLVAPIRPNGVTGASPLGGFRVTAAMGLSQPARIRVARSDGVELLGEREAADWGFSPDDQRFVVATISVGGAPPTITVFDLSTVPATTLAAIVPSGMGSAVSFSPGGHYLVDLELGPTAMIANLRVWNVHSRQEVHTDSFSFTSVGRPGAVLGAAVLGFGPDPDDRTLAYAWVSGQGNTNRWAAVNLDTSTLVVTGQLGGAFAWGFSPCGDVIGVIDDNLVSSLKNASVHATLITALRGAFGPYPSTDTSSQSVNAASHLLQHNTSTAPLAPNTANDACPQPPPNAPPVAAFTAPSSALTLLRVQFNDGSTDPDGRVVAWRWDFGDGQVSSLRSPSHVFTAARSYSVTLTATDDRGASHAASRTIAVALNQPPRASFTLSPAAPASRDTVTFTDTSTDDDGIATRSWTINGEPFSDPVVRVKVCAPSVEVTLSVQDNAGQPDQVTQTTVVRPSGVLAPLPAGADLAAAIAGACPGDQLRLSAGRFAGGVLLPPRISLAGAGRGLTFIEGVDGGWVLRVSTDVTVSDLTVSGGGVATPVGRWEEAGGGLHLVGGQPGAGVTRVSSVEVTANRGSGGIAISDSYANPVEILGSRVHHNQGDAYDSLGSAVGMFCCATVTVDSCEVDGNTSASGAPAIRIWEAERLSFTRNEVHGNGGGRALLLESLQGTVGRGEVSLNRITGNDGGVELAGTVDFAGNLIAGNQGDGIEVRGRDTFIVNCTIADNQGMGIVGDVQVVSNTIVANNAADTGAPADAGSNFYGPTPGFVGGLDYHLAPGSPAIDRGDDAAVPSWLMLDADGDARVLNGGTGEARVDVGWDEATAPVVTAPDAGADAGQVVEPDAGVVGGGTEPKRPRTGCGCQAGAGGPGMGALLWAMTLLLNRRRGCRAARLGS